VEKLKAAVLHRVLAVLMAGSAEALAADSTSSPVNDVNTSNAELQSQVESLRDRLDSLERQRTAGPESAKATSTAGGLRFGDGLIWEDGSGAIAARVTARGMYDYRHYLASDVHADTFSVRRGRIGLGFTAHKWLSGFIESELAFGAGAGAGTATNAGLLQGFVEISPVSWARLRMGQLKPQFTLEATTSPFHVDFQERSLMFNLLQNFLYDRGAMLHGSFLANTSYALSLTNGTGVNLDEFQRNATEAGADGKDLTLRLTADLAPWLEQPRSVIHLGVNYKRGEVANGDATTAGYTAANGVTEGRGLVFFNPITFNPGSAQAASSIDRRIGSLELALAHDRYKLQGEVARATYSGSLASGPGFERDITAGYLSLSWLISGESFADAYRNGTFSRIRPRQDATATDKLSGAWQASLRYSFFDGDDFRSTNAAHTGQLGGNTSAPQVTRSTSGAKAWTAALKWMASPNVALMLNYVRTHFDSPVVSGGKAYSREDAVTLRSQIDFF